MSLVWERVFGCQNNRPNGSNSPLRGNEDCWQNKVCGETPVVIWFVGDHSCKTTSLKGQVGVSFTEPGAVTSKEMTPETWREGRDKWGEKERRQETGRIRMQTKLDAPSSQLTQSVTNSLVLQRTTANHKVSLPNTLTSITSKAYQCIVTMDTRLNIPQRAAVS